MASALKKLWSCYKEFDDTCIRVHTMPVATDGQTDGSAKKMLMCDKNCRINHWSYFYSGQSKQKLL